VTSTTQQGSVGVFIGVSQGWMAVTPPLEERRMEGSARRPPRRTGSPGGNDHGTKLSVSAGPVHRLPGRRATGGAAQGIGRPDESVVCRRHQAAPLQSLPPLPRAGRVLPARRAGMLRSCLGTRTQAS
jgi:hypothetical protein